MNKKRILGMLIALSGLFLTFSDFKLTGAVVGLPAEPVVKVGGIIILLIGFAIIAATEEEYRRKESELKRMIGEKYDTLPPEEQSKYVKSYRRHQERLEKEKAYQESISKRVIKSSAFEKSIRGHNINQINKIIDKIVKGKGREEIMKGYGDLAEYGSGLRSIRVTKGSRILFRREAGKIIILDYLPASEHY